MMSKEILEINEFANRCGHFFNAYLEKDLNINNGYNCNHQNQDEFEIVNGEKIGKCFCWSCPLGREAFEEDFEDGSINNHGCVFEEMTYIVVEQD